MSFSSRITGQGRTCLIYGVDGDLDVFHRDGMNYGILILARIDHLDHVGNLLRFVWRPEVDYDGH